MASPEGTERITLREIITKKLRSLYIDVPALRPGTIAAYALAFASAAVATALRFVVNPYVEGATFVTYFPAIVLTTTISGFSAGLVSVVLSTAAVYYFILQPRFSFYVQNWAEAADLLV